MMDINSQIEKVARALVRAEGRDPDEMEALYGYRTDPRVPAWENKKGVAHGYVIAFNSLREADDLDLARRVRQEIAA